MSLYKPFLELRLDARQKVSSQRLSDYLLITEFVPVVEEGLGGSYEESKKSVT